MKYNRESLWSNLQLWPYNEDARGSSPHFLCLDAQALIGSCVKPVPCSANTGRESLTLASPTSSPEYEQRKRQIMIDKSILSSSVRWSFSSKLTASGYLWSQSMKGIADTCVVTT